MAGKKGDATEEMVAENENIPQAAPLRRPHSPMSKNSPRREDDAAPDTGTKNYQSNQNNDKKQPPRNFKHGPRNFNNSRPDNSRQDNNKMDNSRPDSNRTDNKRDNRQPDRRPATQNGQDDKEDWGNKNPKPSASTPSPVTPPVAVPQPKPQQEPKADKPAAKPPGTISDTTPSKGGRKLVPANYLIEQLSIGDVALLSVETSDTKSNKPGLVCLSMHERYEALYQDLCELYTVHCEAISETITPSPGESFSYLDPSDGGWYRGRCLNPTSAALLDSGRVVALTSGDKMKKLTDKYETSPEFCCLLNASNVKVGDSLKCKLISKTADGFKVSLENVETGASVGEGEVSRWLPAVEYPPPPTPAAPVSAQPIIPEVPRPDLINNSKVFLVDATAVDRAFVRPSDSASQRRFDQILQDVVLYGRDATPLKEPPTKGQVVIGKFTDGLFYRALCKRTNVKQNKYLLEYIEFGNVEITSLDNIYPCPPALDVSSRPTEASLAVLQCGTNITITPQAAAWLDQIKDDMAELTLTIPSGATTAASGSAVILTQISNNENLNKKLEQLCTPDWKKMEEAGKDVVETKPLMYSDLECLSLPAEGCTLDILDITSFEAGSVSGCQSGLNHEQALARLTEQMAEYCNSELGKEPYLPKFEELCIARFPPYPQWFRAVLLEQCPGAPEARVCYVDYGNVAEVPVTMLRKMLPEFVRGQPALAVHLEIKDFPKRITPEMLARAVQHMKIDDEGRGKLAVTRCEKQDTGLYLVHAPALIHAMNGQEKFLI